MLFVGSGIRRVGVIKVEVNFEYEKGVSDLHGVDAVEVEHGFEQGTIALVAFEGLLVEIDHLRRHNLTPKSRKSTLFLMRELRLWTKFSIPFFTNTLFLG
jgi:hypothetical protein